MTSVSEAAAVDKSALSTACVGFNAAAALPVRPACLRARCSVFNPHAQGGANNGDTAAALGEADSMQGSDAGDDDAASEGSLGDDSDSCADAPSAAVPPIELTDLDAEVRLLHAPPCGDSCVVEVRSCTPAAGAMSKPQQQRGSCSAQRLQLWCWQC